MHTKQKKVVCFNSCICVHMLMIVCIHEDNTHLQNMFIVSYCNNMNIFFANCILKNGQQEWKQKGEVVSFTYNMSSDPNIL